MRRDEYSQPGANTVGEQAGQLDLVAGIEVAFGFVDYEQIVAFCLVAEEKVKV